jgi:hypothetical protein
VRLPTTHRPARVACLVAAAMLALFSAVPRGDALAQAGPSNAKPSLVPELDQLRAALDKYRDPIAAVRDGYFSTVGCIAYPNGGGEGTMPYAPGGMGVHFLNMQLVGAPIDSLKPQVLIYQPVGDSLRLVAAEWFVPVQAAGGRRPTVFGKELEGPMVGHMPLMPEGLHHYDLHVWLWKPNPAGTFSATNPSVKCPKASYSFTEHAPKMVNASAH